MTHSLHAWHTSHPLHRILLAALLAALVASVTGCIPYPVYKTTQPAAHATVLDAQSQPLAEARVVLISSAFPYGRERLREEAPTAPDGVARFDSKSEWQAESMMLHGAQIYFWNWCVEKPGYETYETLNRDASEFDAKLVVKLPRGDSRPCDAP